MQNSPHLTTLVTVIKHGLGLRTVLQADRALVALLGQEASTGFSDLTGLEFDGHPIFRSGDSLQRPRLNMTNDEEQALRREEAEIAMELRISTMRIEAELARQADARILALSRKIIESSRELLKRPKSS